MLNFLLIVIVAVVVSRLSNRVTTLQRRVAALEQRSSAHVTTSQDAAVTEVPQQPAAQTVQTASAPQDITAEDLFRADRVGEVGRGASVRSWFLHEWPMKVGALLVLSAIGWMATYAMIHDIIGPVGRTALAFVLGVAFYVFGAYRIAQVYVQGAVALFMGLITLAIALFAGVYYGFFVPAVMIFPLLVATVFVAYIAQRYARPNLAAASIFFAFLVPLLFIDMLSATIVLLYVLVLALGVVPMIIRGLWRDVLLLLALGAIAQSVVLRAVYGFDAAGTAMLFAAIVLLLYGTHLTVILRVRALRLRDMAIGGTVGTLAWLGTVMIVERDLQAIVLAIAATIFALGVFAVARSVAARRATLVYGGVALGLVCSAVASALLDNIVALTFLTTAAVTLYLLGLVIALWRDDMSSSEQSLYKVSFTAFIVPVLVTVTSVFAGLFRRTGDVTTSTAAPLMLPDGTLASPVPLPVYDVAARLHQMQMEALTLSVIVAIGAFAIAGVILQRIFGGNLRWTQIHDGFHKALVRIFGTIGAAYASASLWIGLQEFLPYGAAVTIALVIYAAIGVAFYIHGGRDGYKPYRVIGSVFLILVATHLFLYDFWTLSVVAKIAVFALTGILFISTAFFARQSRHGIL